MREQGWLGIANSEISRFLAEWDWVDLLIVRFRSGEVRAREVDVI